MSKRRKRRTRERMVFPQTLSECCGAPPDGDVSQVASPEGRHLLGRCSACKENATFYEER